MQQMILLLCTLVLCTTAKVALADNPTTHKPSVIYGQDSRYDYYEIQDPNIQHLANSTVVLAPFPSLSLIGDTYFADVKTWGEEENLCSDEPYSNQPSLGFCSGSLIAPDLVLTAGHCLTNFDDCQQTAFIFDYSIRAPGDLLSTAPTFSRQNVYQCAKLIYRANSNSADFAVVRLDRPVEGRVPLRLTSTPIVPNSQVFMLGYPMGIPLKLADDAVIRSVSRNIFYTNLDAYGGNSGSPVFLRETNEVIGILTAGENDTVFDDSRQCYRTQRCTEDGCRGETVMKVSVLRKRLGI